MCITEMSNAVGASSPSNYTGQLFRLIVPIRAVYVKKNPTKIPPSKLKLPTENIKTLPK